MCENTKLLLVCVAIGLVSACITAWFLYQNKTEYWKVQAHRTFRQALEDELRKRNEKDIYFHSDGYVDASVAESNDREKRPITVSIESEHGIKKIVIPYERHIHNIERASYLRGLRSVMLNKYPLRADSLNLVWEGLLAKMGYPGKTAVRVSVTDWQGHETYTYSDDSFYVAKSDSLVSYYLGYRCEFGVTGYTYFPLWKVYSLMDILWLCILVVGCFCLPLIQNYVVRGCHRFFFNRTSMVAERKVSVVVTDKSGSCIYQLEDDLFFDTSLRELKNTNGRVILSPMSAKLLRGFLDAKDCRLSNDEIMELLWPDGTGTSEKVHTNIKRLREYLSQNTDWTIENERLAYQLKKGHFIEEKSELQGLTV